MENLIKNSINEIKNLRLDNKELITWKLKTLEKGLTEKHDNFRGILNTDITGHSTTWSYKRGYFIIILDCYDRILINKDDKTAQEIFDKYKDLMINYSYESAASSNKKAEYEKLLDEILDLKKEIFELNEKLKNLEENGLIESLEKLIVNEEEFVIEEMIEQSNNNLLFNP